MKTTLLHSKHSSGVRPAALALALLSVMAMTPVYAGNTNTCDLNNGSDVGEVDGGSDATGGLEAIACGNDNHADGAGSSALGHDNFALGFNSTAVGASNRANVQAAQAFGVNNTVNGFAGTAIGVGNTVAASHALAVGNSNYAFGQDSVAVGLSSTSSGKASVAFGSWFDRDGDGNPFPFDIDTDLDGVGDASSEFTIAFGQYATAIGPGARADGDRSAALGAGAFAPAFDSVALGSFSIADRDNTLSVGSAGNERQIANVAAGTQDTDAVNVAQLNTGLQNTLDLANAYTDMVVNNIGVDPVDLDAIKDYADLGDQQTLNAAHDYADAGDAQTLAEANAHADAGDTKTLSSANSYTDSKIQQLTGFDSTSFNGRLGALENRVGELDKRINRGNAMGAALAGMSANAVAGSGPNGRIAIGVGAQGGKRAAAFGYGKKFDRASFTLGGAFSGSEKAVNAGFGFDL